MMKDEPAFPTTEYISEIPSWSHLEGGLTKREYFAAKAMQGFCSLSGDDVEKYNLRPENVAAMAVSHADALIKELEKGE